MSDEASRLTNEERCLQEHKNIDRGLDLVRQHTSHVIELLGAGMSAESIFGANYNLGMLLLRIATRPSL